MSKFQQDVQSLISLIGGRGNVAAVSHCVTRMRFVLKDPSLADVSGIEKLKAVKGTFTSAGQFQVIIGNDVPTFYNEFTAAAGITAASKEEAKDAAKANMNWLQRLMANLAEIFSPIIPALVIGGLILGFRNILEGIEFESLGGTITSMSPFWNGVNHFLWLPGEAIFHFLPVGITWSITKKMGTTQILGIILGVTLVSSQLLNGWAVAGTPAHEIPYWDFGFAQINMIGYQAQVIPAILAGFALVYLERFARKISPEAISMIIVPFLALIPAIFLAHTVLGPIGWWIGSGLADGVYAGLTSSFNWLFAAVFGFAYGPAVITGLHHMTNAIDSQLVAQFGGTILWPMIALSNIAQGSAVLGMVFVNRRDEEEKQVSIPAMISAYLGVTEPAMFGINLKYGFPFLCGMIGAAIASVISVGGHVMANSIGVGGLPGILSIQTASMATFAMAMLVAIAVPFVLTVLVAKKKLSPAQGAAPTSEASQKPVTGGATAIAAISSGEVLPLAQAQDKVFAEGMMGEGFVMEPVDDTVVAPFDGVVATLFPTKHAIGLVSPEGVEVLIHIGMDTVKLNGQHFTAHVQAGDTVKKGDRLVTFDSAAIKSAGYLTQTPVIVTNTNDCKIEIQVQGATVQAGQPVMKAMKL
ncbi:MAG: PTS system trehalose-specific EIIBC component [Turicibacter sp.]|nr:PTS system trehalose-specific EIIBC component [Turicibacter sp.]